MHWAKRGAQIADLYVLPASRGRGLALQLLASCCSFAQAAGGAFIRGGAYDQRAVRRLYSRFAIVMPNGDAYCAGRAFRHMARLSDRDARSLAKSLPKPSWNFEA